MQTSDHYRLHGAPPYKVAVLHGGPAAVGSAAGLARGIAREVGVVEVLQTRASIAGIIAETAQCLEEHVAGAAAIVGHSWGAMLGCLFTAERPDLVRKLVLVGSGVFEEQYASQIMKTRLARLNPEQRTEVVALCNAMDDPGVQDKDSLMARFGALMTAADAYDVDEMDEENDVVRVDFTLHQKLWAETLELRRNGKLLPWIRRVRRPVLALHGEYDAHPAEGVEKPLSRVLRDFQWILLQECGHYPWKERRARDIFFRILLQYIEE